MKSRHGWFRLGLLVAALGCFVGIQPAAAQYTYTTNSGAITITGYTGPGGDVTIPGTINGLPVIGIGNQAFYNCGSLTGITIPASLTTLGFQPFRSCASLTAITVDILNPSYASVDGVLFNKSLTTLIQCPEGKAGSYAIPASVASITHYAFSRCATLTSVYCYGNAPAVGTSVFEGANLATVYYLAGTTGWGPTFGGRPTALWYLPVSVTVTTDPAQGGTATGSGTYPVGTSMQLAATAANDWMFAEWSDGSTANPRTVVAVSNLVLTGEPFTLRVTVANRGQVAGNGGMLHLFASRADLAVLGAEAGADAAVPVGVIAAGGTGTFDVQLQTPAARGTHHVRAYVVSPETEWSTGDNQLAITYGIQSVQVSIQVQPGVGVVVTWNNYWGDVYTVYRKVGLSGVFTPLATGIPSARPDPVNVFIDTAPPAGGSAFYKVGANAW